MTDPTVVNLCRQYLATWDNAILPLLCDRLEELNEPELGKFKGILLSRMRYTDCRFTWTVPLILKQYGGDP